MAKFTVTYADLSKDVLHFAGEAEELFEQLFSHLSDEVKELCGVEKHADEPVEEATEATKAPAKPAKAAKETITDAPVASNVS